jgi:hypothetical protein
MKAPKPLDLPMVLRTFEAIPELAGAGAFAGANALYLEHVENPVGRFSLDIDLQNQTEPTGPERSSVGRGNYGSRNLRFRDPANAGCHFIPLLRVSANSANPLMKQIGARQTGVHCAI